MHILVADDSVEHRTWLAAKLAELGHSVVEALNEQNVLKICKNKCPDLLFINSKLSGISGMELVYNIRQLGGSAVWNTIVLMAEVMVENDFKQGLDCGADDFLLKPINYFQLLYKLSTAKRHQELKNDIFEMAHDLAIANHALENVNKKDVMTGICDVNTFYRKLETEWFKAKKENYEIFLILLNLDYFRAYNEIYGADVGDKRIKQIAKELQNELPAEYSNNIARTAGETFAVLLPHETTDAVLQIAHKLIKSISNLGILHKGSACSNILTISAGVAVTNPEMNNSLELLEAADFALYTAKHTGRNKYYVEPAKVT